MQNRDAVFAMSNGTLSVVLQKVDTDEEHADEKYDGLFLGGVHGPKLTDGSIVVLQSQAATYCLGFGICSFIMFLNLFIQRADGHYRVSHSRLKATKLHNQMRPEVWVCGARQEGSSHLAKVLQRSGLVGPTDAEQNALPGPLQKQPGGIGPCVWLDGHIAVASAAAVGAPVAPGLLLVAFHLADSASLLDPSPRNWYVLGLRSALPKRGWGPYLQVMQPVLTFRLPFRAMI